MTLHRTGYCIYGFVFALTLYGTHAVSAQANPEPCKLITQAEVSAAAGVSMGAGVSMADGRTCSWSGKPMVIISLWFPEPRFGAGIQHPNPPVTQAPAPGMGDAAYYNTMGPFTSLGVKKGNGFFVVKIYGIPDQSKQKSVEKILAANILAKM